MSAIAGLWRFDGRTDAGDACAKMLQALAIYGPDASDFWDDGRAALGRRLYRLLPEDRFDRQPVEDAERRFVLVGDLRLDNREDVAHRLDIAAGDLDVMSDASLLLAAWVAWREKTLDALVGDYAFAVFDRQSDSLVLARDPVGMRPLFYHEGAGFLAFASMAKGLHVLPELPYAPDGETAAEWLALMPAAPSRTFFQGISRIEPGSYRVITPTGAQTVRYWNPDPPTLRLENDHAYADELIRRLDEAVKSRLRGAGNRVAAHLSAGFDSGAVAGSAARVQALSGGKVAAFTATPRLGYDGAAPERRFADEGPGAAATAALYPNIEHVILPNDGRSPFDGMDRMFFVMEQPPLNLCNMTWINAINEAVRDRGMKVLLTGGMGNMTISYSGEARLPEMIAKGQFGQWFAEAAQLMKRRVMSWKGVLAMTFGPWIPERVWLWLERSTGRAGREVAGYSALSPRRLADMDLAAKARERNLDLVYRPRKNGREARLWALRRVDQGAFYKGMLAGWGVDVRDPTVDRRLIEFCLSVPSEQWLSGGVPRKLPRLAFAGRLPAEVLWAKAKGLQRADWHEAVGAARDQLGEEIERFADNRHAAEALDVDRLRDLLKAWPPGGWEKEDVTQAYRLAMLRGVSMGHFLRKASGGNA